MALDIGDIPVGGNTSANVALLGIQGGTKAVVVSPYVLPAITTDIDGGTAVITITPIMEIDGGDASATPIYLFDGGGSI